MSEFEDRCVFREILHILFMIFTFYCAIVLGSNNDTGCLNQVLDVRIVGIGFESCRDECRARTECIGISYRNTPQICVIHGILENQLIQNNQIYDCPGFIFANKFHWKQAQLSCDSVKCKRSGGGCLSNNACIIHDCPYINITGLVIVYGNLRTVGAKLVFRCRGNYTLNGAEAIQCMSDGSWSQEPPNCTSVFQNADLTSSDVTIDDEPISSDTDMELNTWWW